MNEPELLVDQLKTTEPVHMDHDPARHVWPHLPPKSTPEAYLQPREDTAPAVVPISGTPETEPGNWRGDGPHFARTVEDHPELGTVCGQCGKGWPCEDWTALTPPERPASAMDDVAAAYDLSVPEMDRLLRDAGGTT